MKTSNFYGSPVEPGFKPQTSHVNPELSDGRENQQKTSPCMDRSLHLTFPQRFQVLKLDYYVQQYCHLVLWVTQSPWTEANKFLEVV